MDAPSELASAERCLLTWRPASLAESRVSSIIAMTRGELWIGGLNADEARGIAVAYSVKSEGESRLWNFDKHGMLDQRRRTMKYGRGVAGFAFLLNMFDEAHVAVARCPPASCSLKGKLECKLEFHSIQKFEGVEEDDDSPLGAAAECGLRRALAEKERRRELRVWGGVDEGRRLLGLSGSGQSAKKSIMLDKEAGERIENNPGGKEDDKKSMVHNIPIPPGLGSLAHDSGLSANPGRFFTAAWTGLTADNIQATQLKGAPPEDRIFMFRQPILQTGQKKTYDEVKFKVLLTDIIGAGCVYFNLKSGLCEPPEGMAANTCGPHKILPGFGEEGGDVDEPKYKRRQLRGYATRRRFRSQMHKHAQELALQRSHSNHIVIT